MEWERYFDEKILMNGYAYYRDDKVKVISYTKNTMSAIVEGTESYYVFVDKDRLKDMRCTCPYHEKGHNCKHMVAVLHTLDKTPKKKKKAPKTDLILNDDYNRVKYYPKHENLFQKKTIASILELCTKEELIYFTQLALEKPDKATQEILALKDKYKATLFKNKLEELCYLYVDNNNQIKKDAKGEFVEAFKKYLNDDLIPSMKTTSEEIAYQKTEECVFVYDQYLINENIDLFPLYEALFACVKDSRVSYQLQEYFRYLILSDTIDQSRMSVYCELVDDEEKMETLKRVVYKKMFYSEMNNIYKVALNYVLDHEENPLLYMSEFLNSRINLKICEDYFVENIAKMKAATKDMDDIENMFLKQQTGMVVCNVYERLGMIEELKEEIVHQLLSYRLGDINLYTRLKTLCPNKNEWIEMSKSICNQLSKQNVCLDYYYFIDGVYAKLWKNVKNDFTRFQNYEFPLTKRYPTECLELYENHITQSVKVFKTREDYAYLGCLLERMATIEGGKEKAIQLRKQIISANPKKRALSEELMKVNL